MVKERLTKLLADSPTLEIATATEAGRPWIAAAFFAEVDPFTLLVMIEDGGTTLANIQAGGRIAVMLQAGNPMALFAQGEGSATLVEGESAAAEHRKLLVRKTPGSEPLVSLPNLRPVRINVETWRVTDVPAGWLPARELHAPREADL